jgi:hypothetical protein
MSNISQNTEQDQKIELTPSQLSPGLAKPEDFDVSIVEKGHGQSSQELVNARLTERPHRPTPERNRV